MSDPAGLTFLKRAVFALAIPLLVASALAQGNAPPPSPTAPATPPASVTPAAPAAPEAPKPAEPSKPAESSKPADTAKEPATETAKPTEGGGEMREIAARSVLRIKGQTTWENGFDNLRKAIAQLEDEAKRLNLVRDGQPMTYFIDSDDLGFTYEALLPLKEAPPSDTKFGKDFDAATSPAGRAVVFTHQGAYDEIDTAYEALTAWLDDKNLVSTGKFLEEYENIPEKSDDPAMKLKIIVFLK